MSNNEVTSQTPQESQKWIPEEMGLQVAKENWQRWCRRKNPLCSVHPAIKYKFVDIANTRRLENTWLSNSQISPSRCSSSSRWERSMMSFWKTSECRHQRTRFSANWLQPFSVSISMRRRNRSGNSTVLMNDNAENTHSGTIHSWSFAHRHLSAMAYTIQQRHRSK